jgi:hypothetical protein
MVREKVRRIRGGRLGPWMNGVLTRCDSVCVYPDEKQAVQAVRREVRRRLWGQHRPRRILLPCRNVSAFNLRLA